MSLSQGDREIRLHQHLKAELSNSFRGMEEHEEDQKPASTLPVLQRLDHPDQLVK